VAVNYHRLERAWLIVINNPTGYRVIDNAIYVTAHSVLVADLLAWII
jgi:hypothetical protein